MEISSIFIHPVKSCRGIELKESKVNKYGFKYDRFWMIVDENNRFITQRNEPKLALLKPIIKESEGLLVIKNVKNNKELELELNPNQKNYSKLQVTVWDDNVAAYDCGEEANLWINGFLVSEGVDGIKAKICFKDPDEIRTIRRNLPPKDEFVKIYHNLEVSFSDATPFLIITQESLSDLNSRLVNPVETRNFRPNIVVKGSQKAYEEDTWKKILIGGHLFFIISRCTRCTRERNALEPLKTLQSYRRVDKGAKYHACFGMNAIHSETDIIIKVGDLVEVVETGEHQREKQ
ncbi:433_t:CDS:2 [Entrophospora sp. SA101]|nr:433_t:CDS:2 [Entrophospora sp. SA101]CAJ0897578.1 10532_t:CDS:2 [Entrophospora sp. SA101]